MTASVLLFDPTAPRQQAAQQADNTLAGLAGTVVGFIDNAKPNFNHLVDDLSELLVSRYGVSQVIKRRKRAASIPAAADVYQELAERCDLVITGSGD
jgi:ABC-type transporter Mla subunit MlaD